MKRISIIALLVCATIAYIQSPLLAQTNPSAKNKWYSTGEFNELSPSDRQAFEQSATDQVRAYQDYLRKLAQTTGISKTDKEYYYQESLNLFIGKGKRYQDYYGNWMPAVVTEVSSVTRGTVTPVETATYLRRVMNYRYERVDLDSAAVVRVDHLVKISDTEYRSTAHIAQKFTGWRDGRIVYSDITWKDIEIIIRLETPITGPIWVPYLGNTRVVATERVR